VPYYEIIIRSDSGRDVGRDRHGDAGTDAEADPHVAGIAVETGLRCTRIGHATRLDGELIDSAALHGAIARVFQLGLDLRAVERRYGRHAM
jgi:hypothetical protein